MMKRSRIVGSAAFITLIAGAPAPARSQTIPAGSEATIQTQGAPASTDIQKRLAEVGRRLNEASSPTLVLCRSKITSKHSAKSREAIIGRR